MIGSALYNDDMKGGFDKKMIDKFRRYFPPSSWPSSAFCVRYEVGNTFIQIEKNNDQSGELNLTYSEFYEDKFQECDSLFQEKTISCGSDEALKLKASYDSYEHIIYKAHEEVGETTGNQQYFIPAGRSFFAVFQDNIFSLLSREQALDPFLVEFGSSYEQAKRIPEHLQHNLKEHKNISNNIDDLIHLILNGEYKRDKSKDILIQEDGRRIYLENASSGQQEMLPLSIMLSFFGCCSIITDFMLRIKVFCIHSRTHPTCWIWRKFSGQGCVVLPFATIAFRSDITAS